MKAISRILAGAGTAALMTVSLAAPAEAQYRYRDRDRGIDAGDVFAGVAILGGIAAIASALDRDGSRYGYGYRTRYRNYYGNAVNSCGYEAQRFGRGRVHVTDVDRRGSNSYRVRGVIDAGYDGYDRYRGYGYSRGGYDRISFACTARGNGRVTDFDINRW